MYTLCIPSYLTRNPPLSPARYTGHPHEGRGIPSILKGLQAQLDTSIVTLDWALGCNTR
jgi:hypothetical protein